MAILLLLAALIGGLGRLLRWLLVLLGFGVLALLLWLLFGRVGTGPVTGDAGLDPVATATAPEPAAGAAARNAALRQEREALLAALAGKAAQCSEPAAPDASRELRLPGDARAGSSLAFLQGVWRCDSDLSTTKDPVIVDYLFDGDGKGQLTIKTDQRICTAGARASMDAAGQLLIESDAVIPCSTGGPIDGQRVECARNGAATTCQGVNMTSKGVWKARFLKF